MKFKQIILLAFFSTLTSFGQSITKEIDSIYSFKPSKLTDKERELKMPALDRFWEMVKNDTLQNLPLLRKELQAKGHNPFFYYDGSGLLLSLTNNKVDKELGIEAISKCDLDDISQKIYVKSLNQLASEGYDVTKPAIKILYEDDYSFYIQQHAMLFNQGYCLTYMLLPQKDKSYVDTLISIFKDLKPTSQKSIITTLWFEYSCKGDDFLKLIIADKSLQNEVRDYAKKILGYKNLSKDQEVFFKAVSKEDIKNIRIASLERFSDEAIEELDFTTKVIRKNDNCH